MDTKARTNKNPMTKQELIGIIESIPSDCFILEAECFCDAIEVDRDESGKQNGWTHRIPDNTKIWMKISTTISTTPDKIIVKGHEVGIGKEQVKQEIAKICKTCDFWSDNKEDDAAVEARACKLEPFDVRNMEEDQMAAICGHDGGVFCGSKFGCIHWKIKESL